MTDETPVGPALTPEEWREMDEYSRSQFDADHVPRGPARVAWCYYDGSISLDGEGGVTLEGDDYAKGLHAVAALCLAGRPFGFDRQDVEALQWVLDGLAVATEEGVFGHHDEEDRAKIARAESLAARISALLPPEAE